MINQTSLRLIEAARLNEHIGKPLYESYCFSQIPQTIYSLLTGDSEVGLPVSVLEGLPDRYNQVILILVDAFGWRFFEQYVDQYEFLKHFLIDGVVSKLTTQFPSTTAAHVTTIHTGLPVEKSGVYEWFYYEPLLDSVIAPLLYSFAGDHQRDTLKQTGVSEHSLFPLQTFYQRLQHQGVQSYCFQHQAYAHSPYSNVVCNGATVVPYRTFPEALINLTEAALTSSEKAYYYLYFDGIDAIGHRYGPQSPQFEAEVGIFLLTMERLFHQILAGKLKNTLVLMTADHGQIEVSPQTTIYLNQLDRSIESLIKTNYQGRRLVPSGSPRDMFLYIQDNHLDEACDRLSNQLADRAAVYRTETLIEQGFFGASQPASTLINRLGNLVILPHKHETVWWYEEGRFEQQNFGHHGGLSRAEMETLLLALPYN
ncbi:MAG: alkaline phosphatase family protein [Leptolyngbyaceae cyanobacterium MO_188.B28]|nr:alkaline phosphatase family protein [Leptolyngbyaceae cyanobacterium MO_188.B28]